MKNKKREPKIKKTDGYILLRTFCRAASPLFAAGFYILTILTALLIVSGIIVVFVNVQPEKMLLPPFMHSVRDSDGQITEYIISVGNGLRMTALYEDVSLSDIKGVIYAGIIIAVAILLTVVPICRFLARMMQNIGKKRPLDPDNARYVKFIGLTILIGQTMTLICSRFFVWKLVSTFINNGDNLMFAMGISVQGFLIGGLIILFGAVYGYACREHLLSVMYVLDENTPDSAQAKATATDGNGESSTKQ